MPALSENDAVEEASLLGRIGRGDREAFRQLYARYCGALYSLALRFTGQAGEAEELVQDAFVKIWRSASSYDPRQSRPFTWAVTITRRTCIDHLRRRRHALPTTPLPTEKDAAIDYSSGENVRASVEAVENAELLRSALADKPENQRAALELALYSDLTHSEIAAQLGQPVGTIKTWIRRGLAELRTTVSQSVP